MINKELGSCFDEDRTMISSFHLILVHSNSFAVQTHIHKCLGVLTQRLTTFMDIGH